MDSLKIKLQHFYFKNRNMFLSPFEIIFILGINFTDFLQLHLGNQYMDKKLRLIKKNIFKYFMPCMCYLNNSFKNDSFNKVNFFLNFLRNIKYLIYLIKFYGII